jgi:hypothetical protein
MRHWDGWLHGSALLVVAIAASACASPTSKTVAAFAESAAATTSLTASAAQLDIDIQTRTNLVRAATRFGHGARPPFPPKRGVLVDGKLEADWAARGALLEAMSDYAKALANAADPVMADALIGAANGLSLALVDFSSANAARIRDEKRRAIALAEIERQKAFGNVLAAAGDYAIDLVLAAKIQQVVASMHPTLEKARDLLKADLARIHISSRQKRNSLAIALVDKLTLHATDARLSSADKYGIYLTANDELGAIDARLDAQLGLGMLLDKLVAAHEELRNSSDDRKAMTDFLTAVRAISEKVESYQVAERKVKELRRD